MAHLGLSEVGAETLRRAHAVHPITALQTEYSLFTRDVEAEILPTARELGVTLVAYSPLSRGLLAGLRSETVGADDFRATLPRFRGEEAAHNEALARRVAWMAERLGCTPAQLALAWLLAKNPDVVPIPGTKRIRYLEDNIGAADLDLAPEVVAELEREVPADEVRGDRYAHLRYLST